MWPLFSASAPSTSEREERLVHQQHKERTSLSLTCMTISHNSRACHTEVHLTSRCTPTYLLLMYCASRRALPLTPETPVKKKQQVWSISFLIQQSVMQAYKITNSPTHSLPAKSTSCSLVQKFDFFDPGTTLLGAEPEYVGSWDREEGSVDLGRRVELAGEAWQGEV